MIYLPFNQNLFHLRIELTDFRRWGRDPSQYWHSIPFPMATSGPSRANGRGQKRKGGFRKIQDWVSFGIIIHWVIRYNHSTNFIFNLVSDFFIMISMEKRVRPKWVKIDSFSRERWEYWRIGSEMKMIMEPFFERLN